MRTVLWVFMNILKKIDFFRAFEKMLKNLTFWTSPKLESLVQSTWGFFFNGFRICFLRKKYFQTDCDLEKKMTVWFSQTAHLKKKVQRVGVCWNYRRDNIVLFDLQEGVLGNSKVWKRHKISRKEMYYRTF
jgi:hypothetical protein